MIIFKKDDSSSEIAEKVEMWTLEWGRYGGGSCGSLRIVSIFLVK